MVLRRRAHDEATPGARPAPSLREHGVSRRERQAQAQIDAIPADTRTLTISSADFYDESMTFTLERELLELEEVQLIDVCFEKIVLDATLATRGCARSRCRTCPKTAT